MAGATVDVTERHHAMAALRESEERFQLAIAGSNDGILDWDLVNDRMFTSERAMEIAGVERRSRCTRAPNGRPAPCHPDDASATPRTSAATSSGEHRSARSATTGSPSRRRYRWVRVRGMRCATPTAARAAGPAR
jgi:PAS domain-containing protein